MYRKQPVNLSTCHPWKILDKICYFIYISVMKRKTYNTIQLYSAISYIIFIVIMMAVLGIFSGCTPKVNRSPLLNDPCAPRPCKYMLEYWYSAQHGEKSLSTWLASWCKEAENKEENKKCKKEKID